MFMVIGEGIFDAGAPITADTFIQDRDNSLHFIGWSFTKSTASLRTFVATSIEFHYSVEGVVGEGIIGNIILLKWLEMHPKNANIKLIFNCFQ